MGSAAAALPRPRTLLGGGGDRTDGPGPRGSVPGRRLCRDLPTPVRGSAPRVGGSTPSINGVGIDRLVTSNNTIRGGVTVTTLQEPEQLLDPGADSAAVLVAADYAQGSRARRG